MNWSMLGTMVYGHTIELQRQTLDSTLQ